METAQPFTLLDCPQGASVFIDNLTLSHQLVPIVSCFPAMHHNPVPVFWHNLHKIHAQKQSLLNADKLGNLISGKRVKKHPTFFVLRWLPLLFLQCVWPSRSTLKTSARALQETQTEKCQVLVDKFIWLKNATSLNGKHLLALVDRYMIMNEFSRVCFLV